MVISVVAHRAGRTDADSVHHREDGGRRRLWGDLHVHGRALPHRGPQRGHGDQFLYRQVWRDGRAVHSLHGTYGGEIDGGREVVNATSLISLKRIHVNVFSFLGHLSHSGDLLLWVGVRRRGSCVVRRPLTSSSQELLSQS